MCDLCSEDSRVRQLEAGRLANLSAELSGAAVQIDRLLAGKIAPHTPKAERLGQDLVRSAIRLLKHFG